MANRRCCCNDGTDDCTDFPIECDHCDDEGMVSDEIEIDFVDFDLEVYTEELLNFIPPKEHINLTGQTFILGTGGENNEFGCCRYIYNEEGEECASPFGPITPSFTIVAEYDWRDDLNGVRIYEGLFIKVRWQGYNQFQNPPVFVNCPDPVLGKITSGSFTLHAKEKIDPCNGITAMYYDDYENYPGHAGGLAGAIDGFTVTVQYP